MLKLKDISIRFNGTLALDGISLDVETGLTTVFIGAGGYGQPILTGIRLDNTALILEGAVPAALLALLIQELFDLADRLLVPLGLRIHSKGAATK